MTEPHASVVPRRRDSSALIMLAAMVVLEVVILYLLIAIETPVSPIVRALLKNPAGVFTLVMLVVSLLSFGMAAFLWWGQRQHRDT